ncbi:MAG: glucuronate isomerase [Oscillospiraceae bacterium]|nr:glucuronate isomerase [Oscillospiraceae bacterium]MBQ4315756.1 glucuronate isomerase [Oscillospiraceae bacterium]MBQ7054289.1 glucuronate isomerase [Oscillospiraceae bacterium]
MNTDFLLTTPLAKKLYSEVARDLPIIDYHNHLPVGDISKNIKPENIAKLWVTSDPYKHRAMRILGIPEKYITGDASDFEKFEKWYASLPRLIGNPLFDWSIMEMRTVFDFELLPFTNAKEVWDELNSRLSGMSARDILGKFNIEYSAPCASLCDDLSPFNTASGLCPSLRGDDLLFPAPELITKLEELTKTGISTLQSYLDAIDIRLAAFKNTGCVFSDHALDNGFDYADDDGANEKRFAALLHGDKLCQSDASFLRSYVLKALFALYAKHGFTVQLHIGAQRSTSTRLRTLAGAAGGYAAAGSCVDVTALTTLLDAAEKGEYGLPRILLFTLNPADNAVMATLCGSYSKDGEEAFVSQGPAWWWCDHYQGICDMLDNFMCHSVLSSFIGMTTDSRSLLSFVRHDYFRRVLCEWISDKVSKNRLPEDFNLLADTVSRICYKNAKRLLGGN